jgi:hypothetical protein
MRLIYAFLALILCSCVEQEQYGNIAEFDAEIRNWGILGKSLDESLAVGKSKGFRCAEKSCSRDIPGFICNQRLRVTFQVGEQGLVSDFTIWAVDGQLPTQCL